MASLVIVESASKCKTIQKYLGSDFKVLASLGHTVNLPHDTLGIDTTTWELTYEPLKEKAKAIKSLKEAAKQATTIYLASDPDREGEAIAWHLKNTLHLQNPKRIVFNEITKTAVQNAIKNPRQIDTDLVAAQEARRALDRLVGYKISPLVGRRFGNFKLSAGRVQSVALRKIVERFQEYNDHQIEKYWNVEGQYQIDDKILDTDLHYKNKKAEYPSLDTVTKLLKSIQKITHWSLNVEQKKSIRNPSAPYTTSALQQEAYETFSIPAKSVMRIAQDLYEAGHITYMRTDSVSLSKDAQTMIQQYLQADYQPRAFKNKVANAQEAHECIRPTHLTFDPSSLQPSHKKIYDLIWRKTIASQMPPAEYADLHFTITTPKLPEYSFQGKLSFLMVPGYLKIWNPKQTEESKALAKWKTTSNLTPTQFTAKGKITKPDGLHNEPSLIKWMEKEGIGRPSTYAGIVDKLFEKGYLSKGPNPLRSETVQHLILKNNTFEQTEETVHLGGKETDRFVPNSIGVSIVAYLQEIFPSLLDYTFTANMEDQLDAISRKENSKTTLLTQFYTNLTPILKQAEEAQKQWRKENPTPKNKSTSQGPPVQQQFTAASLVSTRFGPALYIQSTKKWIGLAPYLKWRDMQPTDLTDKDVTLLTSLPKPLTSELNLVYGKYGFYLTHQDKNYRLPIQEWNHILDNTINPAAWMQFVVDKPAKPSARRK